MIAIGKDRGIPTVAMAHMCVSISASTSKLWSKTQYRRFSLKVYDAVLEMEGILATQTI